MSLQAISKAIKDKASSIRAKDLQRFFKTGPGQYAQGDKFEGLTNPQCRQIAKDNANVTLKQLQVLITSQIHEKRFIALLILQSHYKKSKEKDTQYNFYLKNTKYINNWDLVDLSAPKILGDYLLSRNRNILYKLAQSKCLWERRISIISTFTLIRANQFEDTLKISKILLNDEHDLIHKGMGWMLRQVGKRQLPLLKEFLQQHYDQIPRTTLRYAIEKFQESQRQKYLKKIF